MYFASYIFFVEAQVSEYINIEQTKKCEMRNAKGKIVAKNSNSLKSLVYRCGNNCAILNSILYRLIVQCIFDFVETLMRCGSLLICRTKFSQKPARNHIFLVPMPGKGAARRRTRFCIFHSLQFLISISLILSRQRSGVGGRR